MPENADAVAVSAAAAATAIDWSVDEFQATFVLSQSRAGFTFRSIQRPRTGHKHRRRIHTRTQWSTVAFGMPRTRHTPHQHHPTPGQDRSHRRRSLALMNAVLTPSSASAYLCMDRRPSAWPVRPCLKRLTVACRTDRPPGKQAAPMLPLHHLAGRHRLVRRHSVGVYSFAVPVCTPTYSRLTTNLLPKTDVGI